MSSIRLWCTLIFACMAALVYSDVGHGMEMDVQDVYEWDIEDHSDPVFTMNGHPVNTPSQRETRKIGIYTQGVTVSHAGWKLPARNGSDGLNDLPAPENVSGASASDAVNASVCASYGKLPLYFIRNDGQMDERVKFYEKGSGHTMYFTEDGVYLSLINKRQEIKEKGRRGETEEHPAGSECHEMEIHRKGAPDKNIRGQAPDAEKGREPQISQIAQIVGRSAASLSLPDSELAAEPSKLTTGGSQSATDDSAIQNPQSPLVKLIPLGANKHPEIIAEGLQKGKISYFIGNNPKEWRTNIPTYSAVVYKEIYDGIDIKFYGNNRQLEYDIIVKPGTDPSQVRFAYEGVDDLRVNDNGDLEILLTNTKSEIQNPESEMANIIQKRPYVYQEINGKRVEIEGQFRVLSFESGVKVNETETLNAKRQTNNKRHPPLVYGFTLAPYDTARTLIIDPLLEYSTYIGGSGSDLGYAIAVDGSGSAYITGYTQSSNFPVVGTTTGYFTNTDTFITKLGTETPITLAYSTYIGGSNVDYGIWIAVDGSGSACITGYTSSNNFPRVGTTTAFAGGSYDAFVTKLGVSGDTLQYSTYVGGSGDDIGQGIAVDGSGSSYVVGYTTSSNFPRVGTTTAKKTGEDVFVAKLGTVTPNLQIIYSTYIGGSGNEHGRGITVDSSGSAYIAGYTTSSNFPRVGTTTGFAGGTYDAFVTRLGTETPLALIYSTYIGGSDDDNARGIAVDGSGSTYITGYTTSINFPVVGTTTGYATNTDAFIAKLGTETPLALIYSTYIGGSGTDASLGIAVDSSGSAYLSGYTTSTNFPVVGTTTGYAGGTYDTFVTKLGTGAPLAIIYSTYIGGSGSDVVLGIALDGSGSAYITGYTDSNSDFPRVGTTTAHAGGTNDVFVTKLAFTPGATTGDASGVTTSGATLSGTFNGYGRPTTALFQYGITSGVYTGTSSTSSLTGNEGNTTVEIAISGLSAGTTYYYRAAANNSPGTSTGSDASFTTSSSGGGGSSWEPPAVTLSINSTNPSGNATNIPVDTSVSATFSMYINGSTVNTTSIYVTGPDGNKIEGVASTNAYDAIFTPTDNLSYNTTYTAVATKKIQAANWAGTTMESDYSWSFNTESAPIVPTPTPATTASPAPVVSFTPTPVVVITTPQVSPTLVPSPVITATPQPSPSPMVTTSPEATPSPAATATPQPSPSQTPSPTPTVSQGMLELSKEVAYLAGDTVIVTVADVDRNTGTQAEEILTTAIKITGDNYYIGNDLLLDLNEDGADSGTFLATIKTGTTTIGGASAASRSNIGMVKTEQGGTVRVAYNPSSAVSVTKKLSFSSFDATLAFSRPAYLMGEYAEVTLSDAESNTDHKEAETLLEKVYAQTSQFNIAGVRMRETGTDTGVFRGSIQISADSTLDYERIHATDGDTLTASFYDETTTAGFPQLITGEYTVAALPVPTVTTSPATPVPSPPITPAATVPVPSPTPTAVVCGDAEKITVSLDSLELEKGEEGQVTVTVTDADGCAIEGIKVKRKITTSNNKKVKVKPSSRKTDAEGRAVFTITAKQSKCSLKDNCNAKVDFMAKGVKEQAEVTVWLVE